MLTQSLKNKVATLWDKFWSGGISNPLNAIEQITYLLFMKQLEETDIERMNNATLLNKKETSIFSGKYFPPGVDIKNKKMPLTKKLFDGAHLLKWMGMKCYCTFKVKYFLISDNQIQ